MDNKKIINLIKKQYGLNEFALSEIKSVRKEVLDRIEGGALISFSQNFEDIILNRIFKNKKKGTFVDIGAFHPFYNSNTFLFYNRGWSGVNIDMEQLNIDAFNKIRTRDLNLAIPISDTEEEISTYIIKNSSRSSLLKNIAEINLKKGEKISEIFQYSKTLDSVLEENHIKEIDFISIDVEGAEENVLNGFSVDIYNPTIIILEVVFPQTSEVKSDRPEKILKNSKYIPFYFDGINKFFCKENDYKKFRSYVETPPNYFDNFIRFKEILGIIDY